MQHATSFNEHSYRGEIQPVLLKLFLKDPFGFHVQLNKKEYSAYPDEHDIVLYDGLFAKITTINIIKDKKSGKSVTVVEMTYDQADDG